MICARCDRERFKEVRHKVRETVAGLTFVVEMPAMRCVSCGERHLDTYVVEAGQLAIAAELARLGIRTGDAMRYMRRAVCFRAVDFASVLGVSADTVTRWERGVVPVDKATFAVLATLVLERRAGRNEMIDRLNATRAPKLPKKPIKVIAA